MRGKHISVSGATFARLKARAKRDGVTVASLVEAAVRPALNEQTAKEWAQWSGEDPS